MVLVGFKNKANTCYMNSVLQLLLSAPHFRRHLPKKTPLHSLVDRIKHNDDALPIYPHEVIKAYTGSGAFPLGYQHDAHEFLLKLLEDHEKLFQVVGRYAPQANLFRETVLSVCVKGSLKQSLDSYFSNGGGGVYRWPPLLLIHFKRYGSPAHHTEVKCPQEFRVLSRAYRTNHQGVMPSVLTKYSLKGAVLHSGDPAGSNGHYVSVLAGEPPVLADDEHIHEISQAEFQRLVRRAYIVLYVRA